MYRIKVPATTANIGPGFDALGLALSLYNTVVLTPAEDRSRTVEWSGPSIVPLQENKVYTTLCDILDQQGATEYGFHIQMESCHIPVSRGLGSSAAAIVTGVLCAHVLLNDRFSMQEMIELATAYEGHPDNVVPALLGGLTASFMSQNRVRTQQIQWPSQLEQIICVPNFSLSTEKARTAMPDRYTKQVCIHNISRAAYLIAALANSDFQHLSEALDDRIHQPYRLPLIANGKKIMEHALVLGAVGAFVSGAGPSIIVLADKDQQEVATDIRNFVEGLPDDWTCQSVPVCPSGAIVEVIQ